jgi:hypothetical protein
MNLGLWDAMDAGWKLIALLRGWGGTHLLDSYEAERRPVHQRFVAEGIHNYELVSQNLVRDKMEDDGEAGAAVRAELAADIQRVKPREFHTLGIVKGYHYENSPIIVPDGTPAPEDTVETLIPTARPGHIAPHLWLGDGSSLYDHFGKGFTLLVVEGGADAADFTAAAKTIGMPLTIAAPNDKHLPALYGARYALIRPDQHIAWRGDAFADDVLDRVRGA